MVNVLLVMAITAIVTIVGIGLAYLGWLFTRPPKMTWKANVYELSEGIKPGVKDDKGNIVSKLELRDLRPYTKDVIEKIDKKPGITIYRLIKLNRTVENVPNSCVTFWGDKDKEVDVLIDQGSCTVLRKGFDVKSGAIFQPMPHDRVNMIISQQAIRKDRIDNRKDILQALVPWVVVVISMMALISTVYFEVQGLLEINKQQSEAVKYNADKMLELEKIRLGIIEKEENPLGVQEDPPTIPG